MNTSIMEQQASDLSMNRIMETTPRSEQPRRRTISPAQKLMYLNGYEQAIQHGQGGGYLRENGVYSSQITEWRKLRDAGIPNEQTTSNPSPTGAGPGKNKLTREQAEIAKLRKQLAASEAKLATTQTALDIMGKAALQD